MEIDLIIGGQTVFWKHWYSNDPVLAGEGIATASIALK